MAGKVIREVRTVRIAIRRREHTVHELPNGGKSESWHHVVDHYEDVDVQLEIVVDALFASIAERAARNRSGRAIGVNGAIRARCCSPHRRVA